MKFELFLIESESHRISIDEDEFKSLFDIHCKNMDINKPYWRGMGYHGEYLQLEPRKRLTTRDSITGSNTQNILTDYFLSKEIKNYPKRSESIICGNNSNKNTANMYGDALYKIYPFDSTIIASCEEHDFIFTEMHLNGKTIEADDYFAILELANIKGKSYIDILKSMKECDEEDFIKVFGPSKDIESVLNDAYTAKNMQINVGTSKDVNKESGMHELWFTGPCLAVIN